MFVPTTREAAVTLGFFFVLLIVAYLADKGYLGKRHTQDHVKSVCVEGGNTDRYQTEAANKLQADKPFTHAYALVVRSVGFVFLGLSLIWRIKATKTMKIKRLL